LISFATPTEQIGYRTDRFKISCGPDGSCRARRYLAAYEAGKDESEWWTCFETSGRFELSASRWMYWMIWAVSS